MAFTLIERPPAQDAAHSKSRPLPRKVGLAKRTIGIHLSSRYVQHVDGVVLAGLKTRLRLLKGSSSSFSPRLRSAPPLVCSREPCTGDATAHLSLSDCEFMHFTGCGRIPIEGHAS